MLNKDSCFKGLLRSDHQGRGKNATDEGEWGKAEIDLKNSEGRLFRYSSLKWVCKVGLVCSPVAELQVLITYLLVVIYNADAVCPVE